MNPTLSYVPDQPDKVHWLASKAREMGHPEGQMSQRTFIHDLYMPMANAAMPSREVVSLL
jgi:hypothetical protein